MKKKVLTITVDVSKLTQQEIDNLYIEMTVQTEDYPVTYDAKAEGFDWVGGGDDRTA